MVARLGIGSVLLTAGSLTLVSRLTAQNVGALSAAVREYVTVSEPVVALTHARLIDGTGAPVAEDQTVVISNGRIQAVGSAASVSAPAGARVMDLRGSTLLPGFVGLHDHTFYGAAGWPYHQLDFSAPRLYLATGVTTIRTTGSLAPYQELNLKRTIERGEAPGPRMEITGPYLSGNGAPNEIMVQLSGPEEARRAVAYWAEEGATWFKAYTWITRAELGAAIEEAHRRGLKVTGHLCSVSAREAVALGIDNLEHGMLVNTDYVPDKQPDVCPRNARASFMDLDINGEAVKVTFHDMISHHVAMTSTLAVYEASVPNRPPLDARVLEAMYPEARTGYLTARARLGDNASTSPMPGLLKKAMQYEFAFAKAGGLLAAGVDPTGNGGALPGFGDQRNYELFIEAGFTPPQAVQIMSANGAKVLGFSDRLGTVTAGKLADLIVIQGDPVTTPSDIRKVTIVFKDGVGYDSPKLIASVKGLVGLR